MNDSFVNTSLDARVGSKRFILRDFRLPLQPPILGLHLTKRYKGSNGILGKDVTRPKVTSGFDLVCGPAPAAWAPAVELATTRCIGGHKPNPVRAGIGKDAHTNCRASSSRRLGSLLRIAN